MYMSYCRNEGALAEMRACLDNAQLHACQEAEHEVSEREIGCFKTMVTEFYNWIINMELVDEYGELDEDALNQLCEDMRHGYTEDEDYE